MDVERIFHEESGRILATLIGLLVSFDLAEETMREAFTVALEQWPAREPVLLAGFHRLIIKPWTRCVGALALTPSAGN